MNASSQSQVMDSVLKGQIPGYDPYNSAARPYWALKAIDSTAQGKMRLGLSWWWKRVLGAMH